MTTQVTKLNKNIAAYGFTLIELLVVISIIGIILAFSIFGIQNARQSSRDAVRKSDLENIRSALELYKADCVGYPLETFEVGDAITCNSVIYLSAWPEDPTPATRKYGYAANGSGYELCASLENPPDSLDSCSVSCDNTADGTGSECNYQTTNP